MKHPKTELYISKDNELLEQPVNFKNFADGDTYCRIDNPEQIKGAKVLIKSHLYPNQNECLVRLAFLAHALKDYGAHTIELFVPYMPYARMDKSHIPGEALSSRYVSRMLYGAGITTLHTIDCHFMKGAPQTVVEGLTILNTLIQDKLIGAVTEKAYGQLAVIGPDEGSAYMVAGRTMKKMRSENYNDDNDTVHRQVDTLTGDHLKVDDECVLVLDDMISTGSTMIKCLQVLKERGVKTLYAAATHGLFLDESLEKISQLTDGLVYSDTIPHDGSTPVVEDVFSDIKARFSYK